jgi:F-type H+-transporting ATPase subunit delta
MREQDIARQYSEAFFSLACKAKEDKEAIKQLKSLISSFKKEKKIFLIFEHPGISKKEKMEMVDEIAQKNKFSRLVVDFLKLLIINKRISLLELINRELERLEYEKSEVQVVVAEAPVKLSGKQIKSLINQLSEKLKRKIELKTKINPSLLGGLRMVLDDVIIEASLKGQLEKIRKSF